MLSGLGLSSEGHTPRLGYTLLDHVVAEGGSVTGPGTCDLESMGSLVVSWDRWEGKQWSLPVLSTACGTPQMLKLLLAFEA